MGDMGEFWRDVKPAMKEASVVKRATNRDASTETLRRHGVQFDSRNAGAHLIVKHAGKVVDFWPGTGKWIVRGQHKARRGLFPLLRELGATCPGDSP